MGESGEHSVMSYQRAILIRAARVALAERIEQVSVTEGP